MTLQSFSQSFERAQAIKRRKAIWEALHPGGKLEVGQIGPPQDAAHGGARPQRVEFANDTAKVTGESKRRKAIWEALHPEGGRISPTPGGETGGKTLSTCIRIVETLFPL